PALTLAPAPTHPLIRPVTADAGQPLSAPESPPSSKKAADRPHSLHPPRARPRRPPPPPFSPFPPPCRSLPDSTRTSVPARLHPDQPIHPSEVFQSHSQIWPPRFQIPRARSRSPIPELALPPFHCHLVATLPRCQVPRWHRNSP